MYSIVHFYTLYPNQYFTTGWSELGINYQKTNLKELEAEYQVTPDFKK